MPAQAVVKVLRSPDGKVDEEAMARVSLFFQVLCQEVLAVLHYLGTFVL